MSVQTSRSTRADDEWLLSLIRLRNKYGSGRIAQHYCVPSSRVRTICARVLADDLKYSGEAEAVVRAAYWKS